jgi:hypothetical protein
MWLVSGSTTAPPPKRGAEVPIFCGRNEARRSGGRKKMGGAAHHLPIPDAHDIFGRQ